MPSLTATERRGLRAKAHPLRPVVSVGQQGLTPSVLHEIDVSLLAHELIKVRVFNADHEAREAVLARICVALDAAPVQHIGKMLVLWRPAPVAAPTKTRAKKAPGQSGRAPPKPRPRERARQSPARGPVQPLSTAKSAPQARRPRDPTPRTARRPPEAQGGRARGATPAGGGRRRRGVQGR